MKITSAQLTRRLLAHTSLLLEARAAPPVRDSAPRPLFPPRRDLVIGDDDDLRILLDGLELPLTFPLDWCAAKTTQARRDLHAMRWIEALDDEHFQAAIVDWTTTRAPASACTNPLVAASRCVTWMQQLTVRSQRIETSLIDRSSRSIARQVRRIDLALRAPTTWAEKLDLARLLCWAGCWFEGPEPDRWHARGTRLLARVLHALNNDGMIAGQNGIEHAHTCATLLECRAVLGGTPLESTLHAAIERACATLADLIHPDGHPSLFSGGHLHAGPPVSAILDAARRLCNLRAVRRPSIRLDDAGLCGWREARTYFLFSSGPAAVSSRMCSDALAFEWTVRGERMFVAGGVRFAALEIDGGGEGARCARRTRLQVLPDGLVAEGTIEPAARLRGRPLLRRLLRSTGTELRIEDRVVGGAGQEVRAQIVCHPGARVRQAADGSVSVRRGTVHLRIASEDPISIEDATWQPDAGLEVPTRRIVVHYGTAPCGGAIRILSVVAHPAEMAALASAPAS